MNDIINTIQLGDCYELIKTIPDKSIDLIIIDPPYEFDMGVGGGHFGTKERNYHNEYLSLYHETGSTKETERLRISANKQKQKEVIDKANEWIKKKINSCTIEAESTTKDTMCKITISGLYNLLNILEEVK